jgi:hypothetical protein
MSLQVSLKLIFLSQTIFMVPKKLNEMNVQYLPPNRIIGFHETCEWLMYCLMYPHYVKSIWQMQNVWSVLDLLSWNLHW